MSKKASMMFVDFETTGIKKENTSAISIGIVWVSGREIIDQYYSIIKPYNENDPYSSIAEAVHKIPKDKAEKEGKDVNEVMKEIKSLVKKHNKSVFCAHNWTFDLYYLQQMCHVSNIKLTDIVKHEKGFGGVLIPCAMDSQWVAQYGLNRANKVSLKDFTAHYQISSKGHHNALDDSNMSVKALLAATSGDSKTEDPDLYLRDPNKILEF